MKTASSLLFLGTGASLGVPVVGCECEVCRNKLPLNSRSRSSALISVNNKKILIDCGPDFRFQALNYHIARLDGVILTHAHQDHVAGLDELRVYLARSATPLSCLMSQETASDIRNRFSYMFREKPSANQLTTKLDVQLLEADSGCVDFLGVKIQYMSYEQEGMQVNGFRFGDLAYISDIRHYKESLFNGLYGVRTLVISALRFTPSKLHFSVDEAIDFSRRVGAEQSWLTHTSHELDYEKTNTYLPSNIRMAYDGLTIPFDS